MTNGKQNWAILVATATFPVAAIALVLAIRAGNGQKSAQPAAAAAPMAPHVPPHPGMQPHPPPPGPPHGMAGPGPGHRGPPGPHHGPPPDPAEGLQRMASHLGLTDAQLKKVRTIASTARNKGEELGLEMQRTQRQVHALLEDPKTTEAQIEAALKKVDGLRARQLRLQVLTPWRIREVLTPAQQKKLKQLPHPPPPGLGPLPGHGPAIGHGPPGHGPPMRPPFPPAGHRPPMRPPFPPPGAP